MAKRRGPDEPEYKVGYGKPPKGSQFKPGTSGNPKGRPKGINNFATDVEDTLKMPVRVTQDGTPRTISTQKAALVRLRERALGGDHRSMGLLIQLAQTTSGQTPVPAANTSAEDLTALHVLTQRIQSGAFVLPPDETVQPTSEAGLPEKPEPRPKIKRRGFHIPLKDEER